MHIWKKLFDYVLLAVWVVWDFCKMIIESFITLHHCFDFIFGIFYQPIITLVTLLLLYFPLSIVVTRGYIFDKSGYVDAILFLLFIIGSVLSINAIIELFYCIIHKHERYNIIFIIQKEFYNYVLIVISLVALWIASQKEAKINANLELLKWGCVSFLSIFFTDLYNFLIHKPGKVVKLYEEMMRKKANYFNKI